MFTCRQSRSATVTGILLVAMLVFSFQHAEAVPLSRYGRANLARYGKRGEGGQAGAQFVIEDANSKGTCKYTGVGELYWCQFINAQTTGETDGAGPR